MIEKEEGVKKQKKKEATKEKEKEEKKRLVCTLDYDKKKDGKFRYRYSFAKFFILFVSLTFEVYYAHHYCRRSALKLYSSRA